MTSEVDDHIRRLQQMGDNLARIAVERGAALGKVTQRLGKTRALLRRVRQELKDEVALRGRLTEILTRTATALQQQPVKLGVLSDWSSLPRQVTRLVEELRRQRREGVRMLTEERTRELVLELQATARTWVRRYATVHAPHVPEHEVTAICDALGDVSVEEAMQGLDRAEHEAMAAAPR